MTPEEALRGDSPVLRTARRRYSRLSAEQRETVLRGFYRHMRACETLELPPDTSWLTEAIADASNGVLELEN